MYCVTEKKKSILFFTEMCVVSYHGADIQNPAPQSTFNGQIKKEKKSRRKIKSLILRVRFNSMLADLDMLHMWRDISKRQNI